MCLILFAYKQHPLYPLVLAANRDEFYDRPTAPLSFWEDSPDILAGRDLRGKGTWLGISRKGRFAAITNYRDPANVLENAPSRGLLVSEILCSEASALTCLESIQAEGHRYNGFNLIAGDSSGLYYYGNRYAEIVKIPPGIHGLSNRFLDTPWPKLQKGKSAMKQLLHRQQSVAREDLFEILRDQTVPPDEQLPDTGVGLEWERILSPLFITSDIYGTRSSSVIFFDKTGKVTFAERTYTADASSDPVYGVVQYHLNQESGSF
jgi:uncharacterized protein with NRDE domain